MLNHFGGVNEVNQSFLVSISSQSYSRLWDLVQIIPVAGLGMGGLACGGIRYHFSHLYKKILREQKMPMPRRMLILSAGRHCLFWRKEPGHVPTLLGGGIVSGLTALFFWCFRACCGWCSKILTLASTGLCPEIICAHCWEVWKDERWSLGDCLEKFKFTCECCHCYQKFKLKVILLLRITVIFLFFCREDGGWKLYVL